jgi:hypothetical protein
MPRRMTIQGKTVRMAFGSNFVVDPESRVTMAAIQLVKAFMKGTQDVSITDSANENSRPLLRSMGFNAVPAYSLHWARPLRPSQFAVDTLGRMKKSKAVALIGSIAKPITMLADAAATGLRMSPFRLSTPETEDEPLDTETHLKCLTTIPSKHWLLPQYDLQSLTWVFDFIDRRKVFGTLRKALVRDKNKKIVGWYIYALRPGGMGDVLQIGTESPSAGVVLDHMFHDAWKNGLIGLQGRMEPQLMQELTARSCFFFRHGSWTMVHSGQLDLVSLVQGGNAFFSRLDGEWCLRHGGDEH